jgi:hypothetical protein
MPKLSFATIALVLPLAAAAQPVPVTPVPVTPVAPAMPVLLVDPVQVRQCLCWERDVNTGTQEIAVRRGAYEDAVRELQQLDAEIERRRQSMNTDDAAAVESFRQMFDRRQALYGRVHGELIGDYQQTIARYNRAVAGFNQSCSGRLYHPPTVAAVQPTLSCPGP